MFRGEATRAMPITRRTDYATRIMVALAAGETEGPVPAHVLAESTDVPYEFARAILTQMAAAGLVTSVRGAHGGVRLSRPVEDISVADILAATGDTAPLNLCTYDPGYCAREGTCVMHTVWCQADAALMAFLATQDLATLAAREKGKVR